MAARKKQRSNIIYQMKITLKHSKPSIWRRFLVPANFTLDKVHTTLQTIMGWTNSHLHQFITPDGIYGEPDPDFPFDDQTRDERRVTLGHILRAPKDKVSYEYDFGDGWEHELVLEKVVEADPNSLYPYCLTGKRACPPEDVGGIWGYTSFLEALQDKRHPEHTTYVQWIGGSFDPETFDCRAVNMELMRLQVYLNE